MFRGHHAHTIDAKNRVSIPVGFRVEIQRRGDHAPIVTTGHTNASECLWLYPFEDWCELEKRLVDLAPSDLDVQSYARYLISGASPCPIDAQGRMLLPQYLRDHARLERDVTLAGAGKRIELWDSATYQEDRTKTRARLPEIASLVAKLELELGRGGAS
jgi:MraZ protein